VLAFINRNLCRGIPAKKNYTGEFRDKELNGAGTFMDIKKITLEHPCYKWCVRIH